jgi:hypothetical protein
VSFISSKIETKNIIKAGQMSDIDEICPSYVDTKDPNFIKIDDIYVASVLVINYNKEMHRRFF